ncbi:M24 family metallopeptidase [Pseudolysinimonas sp.]|uniref:M24 family metallopeptidase n=1 Tax=Pseudolysinimonas sp. TaxID=2680009 RepID=UPI00378435A6
MTFDDADRPAKIARLTALLAARGADELVLTCTENLAWLFDGARVAVPFAGSPVLQATVTRDGAIRVDAHVNEAARLRDEELPGVDIRAIPWHSGFPTGPLVDTALVAELRAIRAVLLPVERQRYRDLGRDAAVAVSAVLHSVAPTSTEWEVAADLARAIVGIGADPVVILVGGESRRAVRHPLPTAAPLGRRAMIAVGVKRHGLVASLTRWVRFAPTADDALDAALLEVEAEAFAATRPSRPLTDVLADIAAAYPRHGLPPDSWEGHHQGGPAGYLGRDPKATPTTTDAVLAGSAYAWNPSVPGGKVEDTVIIDAEGVEVLTVDPAWPVTTVHGLRRPLPLDR